MAHIIVDSLPYTTTDQVRPPLRYTCVTPFPWKLPAPAAGPAGGALQRASAEVATAWLEGVVRSVVEPFLEWPSPDELGRGTDWGELGLRPAAHAALAEEVAARTGLPVDAGAVALFPSVSRLASALLQRAMAARVGSVFSAGALVRSYVEAATRRQVPDALLGERGDEDGPQPPLMGPLVGGGGAWAGLQLPAPGPGRAELPLMLQRPPPRVAFVLACPHSGASLMQRLLGVHAGVFAPPPLYLLQVRGSDGRTRDGVPCHAD